MGQWCFNPSIGLTSVPTYSLIYAASTRHVCFNPSIGLTSVPTAPTREGIAKPWQFQSLNRAYKRSDPIEPGPPEEAAEFQSLNRAYKRSDQGRGDRGIWRPKRFQSLNRAYKRSDNGDDSPDSIVIRGFNPSIGLTSVPTSLPALLLLFFGGFNPSIGLTSVPTRPSITLA